VERGRHGHEYDGYDHNFVLNKNGDDNEMTFAARAESEGRFLEVHTDQPGLQFYTGDFSPEAVGKEDAKYGKNGGFSMESQGRDSPIVKHYSSIKNSSFVTCVNSALCS
jgi:aldose 1-epimerase